MLLDILNDRHNVVLAYRIRLCRFLCGLRAAIYGFLN